MSAPPGEERKRMQRIVLAPPSDSRHANRYAALAILGQCRDLEGMGESREKVGGAFW